MKLSRTLKYKSSYYYFQTMVDIYCILNNIKMSPQLKDTFIFFCLFGINPDTYKRLLLNKIAASNNVIYNYKSRLASLGLVKKFKSGKWKVLEDFEDRNQSQFNIVLKWEEVDQSK